MAPALPSAELLFCFAPLIQLWDAINGGVLINFLFNGVLLGYVLGGCLLQLLKEKSISIWLPVLLHCLMDYSIILKY